MKYIILFTLLFFINTAYTQDRGYAYIGLYSSGTIEYFSRYVTDPYYKDLRFYTITTYPKLGYRYKNITLGVVGSYTFHKNTFETLESTLGYGYFVRYNYLKKNRTTDKKISVQLFAEWSHIKQDGYYVPLSDWHRLKVHSPVTYYTLQGGLDFLLPKSFSISLGIGGSAFNLLKDYRNPLSEKPFKFRPSGSATLQYTLKI